nr:probable cysteine protease RD19D [Ipomoea batatas]
MIQTDKAAGPPGVNNCRAGAQGAGGGLSTHNPSRRLTAHISHSHASAASHGLNIRRCPDEKSPPGENLLGTSPEVGFSNPSCRSTGKLLRYREERVPPRVFAKKTRSGRRAPNPGPPRRPRGHSVLPSRGRVFKRCIWGYSKALAGVPSRRPTEGAAVGGVACRTNFDWRGKKVPFLKSRCRGLVGHVGDLVPPEPLKEPTSLQLGSCLISCDIKDKSACDDGCSGGLMTNAYEYLMESGGIEEEASYPYTGERGDCRFESEKVAVKVGNFTNLPADEDQMAAYLVNHGPLAVGINAVYMHTYMGGVSCPLICSKRRLNHGVLLVGYGKKGFSILRLGFKPYWIINNSWGKEWGEEGYFRMCRGHGMCGINTMVSAVITQ